MFPNLDIYRTANVLVKQHGADAPLQAAMRADAMLEKADLDQPYRSGITGLTVIYRHSRHILRNCVSSFSSRHPEKRFVPARHLVLCRWQTNQWSGPTFR